MSQTVKVRQAAPKNNANEQASIERSLIVDEKREILGEP